jgi:hypothetical protein
MRKGRWRVLIAVVTLATPVPALATGVPIDGFLPLVGISLSREFIDDLSFAPVASTSIGGPQLGSGGLPRYDVALLDTGAAVSILNTPSQAAFGLYDPYTGEGGSDGFRGAYQITIGGATGFVDGDISDMLGLYAGGLQSRTAEGSALTLNNSALLGQTNTSIVVVPPESDLPNVLGLSFLSQYATRIRSDLPQIFQLAGETVRTPSIEFFPRGSGGLGISRKAPLSLNGATPVTPQHVFDILNLNLDEPWENPFAPTFVSGGLFLNVNIEDDLAGDGGSLTNFELFFDTGASVTVVSELNASRLGFDVLEDEPEFTLAVVGSGGTRLDVPGFFADKFTIQAIGGSIVANNVPIIVLDIADPSDPLNVIDGFVGTNLLSGRNLVIDPNPAIEGGPSAGLYISDPVTVQKNWTTTSSSSNWSTGGNWNGGTAPTTLGIANVRHVTGGNQTAVVNSDATAWEVNVSGGDSATMTVRIESGARLTTYSGVNVEQGGVLQLAGGTLDAQYVEVAGGTLSGSGFIATGSGPIPGQVENRGGIVAPGNGVGTLEIEGRFANLAVGILAIELGGNVAGSGYDQIVVHGGATLGGKLAVSLIDLGAGMFAPAVGSAFTILTASEGISGAFDTFDLPAGYSWNVSYNANSVVLAVASFSLPGDYNGNGVVDAADYTVWRDHLGTNFDLNGNGNETGGSAGVVDQADYTYWKSHFGQGAGAGAVGSAIAATAVPEPAAPVLALAGVAVAWPRRTRRILTAAKHVTPQTPAWRASINSCLS